MKGEIDMKYQERQWYQPYMIRSSGGQVNPFLEAMPELMDKEVL